MFKFALILVKNPCRSSLQQQGSALIIALVFLLIMTLLGIATMRGTSQQEIMARNVRDRDLSFQAAEAVLNRCLRRIETLVPPNNNIATLNLIPLQNPGNDPVGFWRNYFANPASLISDSYTAAELQNQVSQLARCTIEETTNDPLGLNNDPCCSNVDLRCFRVISYGVGGTPDAITITEARCHRLLEIQATPTCNSPPCVNFSCIRQVDPAVAGCQGSG